jgi:hypothetical protein
MNQYFRTPIFTKFEARNTYYTKSNVPSVSGPEAGATFVASLLMGGLEKAVYASGL